MELSNVVENCSEGNQEEAKGTYNEDQEEEKDKAQEKSGRGTGRVGKAHVCAQ